MVYTLSKRRCTRRPGLRTLLQRLYEHGIKLAILSDYSFVEPRLKSLDIDQKIFAAINSTEELGALKPQSHPFVETAGEMGLAPATVLVIGDDAKDCQGAGNAGMPCLKIVEHTWQENAAALTWTKIREKLWQL